MVKNRSGQMLIEVVVALGIITTALVFAVNAATSAQRNSRYVQNEMEANKQAMAVISRLRDTVNQDPDGFFAGGVCGGCVTENATYSCNLSCTFVGGNRVDVIVSLSWTEAGATRTVSVPTILTKYDK